MRYSLVKTAVDEQSERLLTLLDDVVIDLRLGLVVGLLDAGRLDAPVHEQLLERELGDLAANAVEG